MESTRWMRGSFKVKFVRNDEKNGRRGREKKRVKWRNRGGGLIDGRGEGRSKKGEKEKARGKAQPVNPGVSTTA